MPGAEGLAVFFFLESSGHFEALKEGVPKRQKEAKSGGLRLRFWQFRVPETKTMLLP